MIPVKVPYLFPKAELVERWGAVLNTFLAEDAEKTECTEKSWMVARSGDRPQREPQQSVGSLRSPSSPRALREISSDRPQCIGIAWQGNPHHRHDRYRSTLSWQVANSLNLGVAFGERWT